MKKFMPFWLWCTLFLFSCAKEEVNPVNPNLNGNSIIVATVKMNGNVVGKGVRVLTDPYTVELKTDEFGQVKFENIRAGSYDVYSYVEKFSSGKTSVRLGEKDLQNIDIELLRGVLLEPNVDIITPEAGQGFASGEEIIFKANISDNRTALNELTYVWESSVDGTLNSATVDAKGVVTLKTNRFSEAEHIIRLKVTNKMGVTAKDSVSINTLSPRSLVASLVKNANATINISWNSTNTNFNRLEVFRYTSENSEAALIASIEGAQTTNYLDKLVPFADSVFYYVKAYNTGGYSSKSNVVKAKGTPIFSIAVEQVEMHPTQSILYLKSGNTITAIDYATMTKVRELSFGGTIGYFHVANNGYGNELYIPSSDGWLYIYDLASFTLKESINVGVSVECVISDGKGLLYTSVRPSPWWEQPLRVYNRRTLSYVTGGGDFDDTRLRLLPSGNEIIEISTSISPVDVDYYRFDQNGFILQHADDKYHGDHPLDPNIFRIAPFNNYFITASSGAIYSADAGLTYQGSLPRGADEFTDFEFNSQATQIYAGVQNKKSVFVYTKQTLNKVAEYQIAGYPQFMFRKDNQLIIVSSPEPVYSYWDKPAKVGVEIVSL
jgi:hypothetical protein